MDAISTERFKVIGALEFQSIISLHVQAKVNEHATMHIRGILSEANGKHYDSQAFDGGELSLQCDFGKGLRSCFAGKITHIRVFFENHTYFIETDCVSGTRQFDLEAHSRSFQDVEMPYKKLLRSVVGKTGNIVPIKEKDKAIGLPIIQYNETDWEFIRRLASRFSTVIIPEITCSYPQVSFGIVNGSTYEMGNPLSYELTKDLRGYFLKSREQSCTPFDFLYYRIRDYGNYQLGDKIVFKGYLLVVMEKQIDFINGLIEFTYVLGTEKAFGLRPYYNEQAQGLTLEGRVLWTANERVKVKLNIDTKQDLDSAYPFYYVPETGNIMYAMPEKGARIYVYLPASDESGAIAVGCRQPSEEFPHHYTKYLLTPFQKQLLMNPGRLAFAAKRKAAHSVVSIADRLGAGFQTSKSIWMSAQKAITIEAGNSSLMKAGISFKLIQSDASNIEISENTLTITAPKILTSALTVPQYTGFRKGERVVMPVVSGAAAAVLGAIPMGGALSPAAAAVMGGVPGACSPSAKLSPSEMGKVLVQH